MKANTTKEYPFTGQYFGYTLVTSEDQTVTERVYNTYFTNVNMSLSVNLLGDLVIESPTKMQLNGYIKNIVDQNNEEIYTDGEWRIFQTAPVLGPMGLKAGYRYRATIIAGNV